MRQLSNKKHVIKNQPGLYPRFFFDSKAPLFQQLAILTRRVLLWVKNISRKKLKQPPYPFFSMYIDTQHQLSSRSKQPGELLSALEQVFHVIQCIEAKYRVKFLPG